MCGGAIRSSYGRGRGEELRECRGFRGDLRRGTPRRGFKGLIVVSRFNGLFPDAARRVATVVEGWDCAVKRFFALKKNTPR